MIRLNYRVVKDDDILQDKTTLFHTHFELLENICQWNRGTNEFFYIPTELIQENLVDETCVYPKIKVTKDYTISEADMLV